MKLLPILFFIFVACFSKTGLGAGAAASAEEWDVAGDKKKAVSTVDRFRRVATAVGARGRLKSISHICADDLDIKLDIKHPQVRGLNDKVQTVFLDDTSSRCAQIFMWGGAFCLGWSTCAGTWNIWVETGYGVIQGLPTSFTSFDGDVSPLGWTAMVFQTAHAFGFLIPANMAPGYEMLSDIINHSRINVNLEGTEVSRRDTCATASCKRMDAIRRYFEASMTDTFPQKGGKAGSYRYWGNIALAIYSAADSLPELGVLWENLIRTDNYHTRLAVPGFYVQNLYKRWRVGHKALQKGLAILFPGETEEGGVDRETIIKRRVIVQILENAAFNLRGMEGERVREVYTKIWNKTDNSPRLQVDSRRDRFVFGAENPLQAAARATDFGDHKVGPSAAVFDVRDHAGVPATATASFGVRDPTDEEEGLAREAADFITSFMTIGNETEEMSYARKHGQESFSRGAVRYFGYGIGLIGTWGTFEFVRGSLSLALQSFVGVDPGSAEVAGTAIAGLMGVTRALRNVNSTAENYVGFFDALWDRDHYKKTATYDELLRTDFTPLQAASMRAWTYAESIYFSAPWYSILLPILDSLDHGQRGLMLLTFFLAEPSFDANQYNIDFFNLFGEAHRWSCCGCRRAHKKELNRSKMLYAIDRLRSIAKHLPDHMVREFYEDVVLKNPNISDETKEEVRKRVEEDYDKPSPIQRLRFICCGSRKDSSVATSPPRILHELELGKGSGGGTPVLASASGIPTLTHSPERSLGEEIQDSGKTSSSLWDCFCGLFGRRR